MLTLGEEGWSQWSMWSLCEGTEFRVRSRVCVSSDPGRCRGLDHQKQTCAPTMQQGKHT